MTDRAFPKLRLTALAAVLALSGCNWLRSGDKANAVNDSDPEIAEALNDQILVDGNLDNQSNRNAGRTPAAPSNAHYPAADDNGSGGKKAANAAAALGKGCIDAANFEYNMSWANKLPRNFPVYPGGKVTDAAANNRTSCRLRVVTFTTPDGWERILNWYHTQAVRAGYTTEHQVRDGDHVLAGDNDKDKGAFYLIVTPKPKSSEVALIANYGQ
jgi:hypothetical protein